MLRVYAASLALLLLLPVTANAWTAPEERPARNATLDSIVAKAASPFWKARGISNCPHLEILLADLENYGGRGQDCRLWIDTNLMRHAQQDPDTLEPVLCAIVVHELGHANGLAHTEHGIMAPLPEVMPYACRRWATKRSRKRAKARRANHRRSVAAGPATS